jgi:hypothetical protein
MDGVDPRLYERRLAEGIINRIPNTDTKPFPDKNLTFKQIHKLDVCALERDVYKGFEDQIKSVGLAAANHPDSVPPGEAMRRVEKVDQGGTRYIEWVGALRDKNNPELGQRSFVEDFKGMRSKRAFATPTLTPAGSMVQHECHKHRLVWTHPVGEMRIATGKHSKDIWDDVPAELSRARVRCFTCRPLL